LGNALKTYTSRHEVVIATKVFNPMSANPNDGGLSRKHIMHCIDASLKRLQTDYVDIYQIHRWDYQTLIEETMEALHDVVKAGKARYIGTSSMYAWQFAKAFYTADLHGFTRFVSMQQYYNLIYQEEERETIPLCMDQKIAIIPWSPLERGLLTGKRTAARNETLRAQTDEYGKKLYQKESNFAIVNAVNALAEKRGLPPAQIALAWVLSKPYITAPIVGASKPRQLEDAVAALEVRLSPDEINSLESLYEPHPVLWHQ
jgi:aryl-alcohol dehydrogenase-like predicted oxidoreductase